jgi:hypothetical protein
MIGPHFDKLAGKTEGVEFVKVDVDAQEVGRVPRNA